MSTGNKKDRQWGKKVIECFKPVNGKWAIIAMLLSFFTIFAIVARFGKQWYTMLPEYTELITGVTTFSGYNKQIDMKIVTNALWALPAMFFLIQAVIRFFIKKVEIHREAGVFFLCTYVLLLLLLFNDGQDAKILGIVWLVLVLGYLLLMYPKRMEMEQVREFTISVGVFSLAVYSLCLAGISLLQKVMDVERLITNSGFIILVILIILILIYAFCYQKKRFELYSHQNFWQIFIPFGFMGFLSFQYVYEATGEVFTLFYSGVYKYLLCLVSLAGVVYGVYRFLKMKNGITLPTVICVACYRVFEKPSGLLNVDFFHTGEMSVPWQQMEEFGKIPFWDLMPIHGLCDYYYSLINRVFFDGSYLAMNAAMTVGNLLLAVLLACVLYITVKKKEIALLFVYVFMPFMIHGAGIRYIFMFILFFVLFSSKMRENALKYLWWYVFLAIIAIAWNVSIGGAAAAAFFIGYILCYLKKLPKEIETEWKNVKCRTKSLICWSVLVAFGISFIPFFVKIVVYLKENSATTWMANGMEMIEEVDAFKDYFLPSVFLQGEVSFLEIFGFLIPFSICILLAVVAKHEYLKRNGWEFAIILFTCFIIIVNYAFVRFDSGLRTGVISVFFLIVILYTLLSENVYKEEIKYHDFIYLTLFLTAYMLTGSSITMNANEVLAEGKVDSTNEITIMGQTVEDPIVYVSGDSVGMHNLGTGFIGGNTLQNLQNMKYVLEEELKSEKAYLDMTNAVANYQILDGEMVLPYTSGYNISNEQMQKNAIELLKKQDVALILLAPHIRFDEATISLRSPRLYEYLVEAGYEPYVYENVIYMKKGRSNIFEESNGQEAFAQLMHKEALQTLPAVWGNSEEAIKKLERVEIQSKQSVNGQVLENRFDKAVNGAEIDFIEITLPDYEQEPLQANMQEEETVLSLKFEDVNFSFYPIGKKFLIPVFSSPYWKESETISLWSLEVKAGDGISLETLEQCEVRYYCYPKD